MGEVVSDIVSFIYWLVTISIVFTFVIAIFMCGCGGVNAVVMLAKGCEAASMFLAG